MTLARDEGNFRSRLAVEVSAWLREGLITDDQGRRLRERYALSGDMVRASRLGPLTTFLSILGAIVLGTGVVYFFAANWEVMPAWSKVLLVLGSTAAAYAAGYQLQFRSRAMPRVGAALILLGAILFQAGIFLLEQIYNMPVDSPFALLLGTVGILPVAYAARSRMVLLFGLLDGLAWLGWAVLDGFADGSDEMIAPFLYLLAGVLIYAAGHLHRLRRDPYGFAPVYRVLGLAAVFVPALWLGFGAVWDSHESEAAVLQAPWWFFAVVLAALAGAVLPALALRRVDVASGANPDWDQSALMEAGILGAVVLITGLVGAAPSVGTGYVLLFNVVYFGLAIVACMRGYLAGEAHMVNTGITFLAIGLIVRYFDVFWGLLPASMFYVSAGAVLLCVAAGLERLRHRLLVGVAVG
jgi:uncharacterized membrane protein